MVSGFSAVAPPFVRTPSTEQLLAEGLDVQNRSLEGELPNPSDVAAAVCFLASNAARMITGISSRWTLAGVRRSGCRDPGRRAARRDLGGTSP
jgi:NAD(P)-dependent dehydrogenase (short-subunit alcohol dehydrogenase family)